MYSIDRNKNYSNAADIETISVDFKEQLTRSVVDTTVSSIVLKPKTEDVPLYWQEFLDDIFENNAMERLVKTDVRYKSLYGKSYVGFDMYVDEYGKSWPILWIAPNDARNQALRLNGMKPFAVRVRREYAAVSGGQAILMNEVVYTKNDASYLFLGGFGSGPVQHINYASAQISDYKYLQVHNNATFPFDWVSLQTPAYIVQQNKQGTHPHNYGVIPVQEFLNKDVADYTTDNYLSDWYPAADYIPLVSKYLKYVAWEMNLDHTRIMGLFSVQDMQTMDANAHSIALAPNPNKKLEAVMKNYVLKQMMQMGVATGEDAAINQKLIIKAPGGQGSVLEKMNSTFDGEKHVKGLQSLISLIYKVCGYSWAVEDATKTYENIQQTQQTIRSVYETTKEKVELFTRQWKTLLAECAYAYFRVNDIGLKTLKEVREEFKKYIEFIIVSNIITNQNNDWRRTMELHNNNLISTQKALEAINPEYTKAEIEAEIELIKANSDLAKSFNDFNAFENSKPTTFNSNIEDRGE